MLCADLHWASERNASKGFLAAGGAKPVGTDGGSFDFDIIVRPQSELRFVNAIVYLEPTGNWSNHTFAATTGLIPVTSTRDDRASAPVRMPVRQLEEGHSRAPTPPSSSLRYTTGIMWLAGAVLLWLRRQNSTALEKQRRWWWAFLIGVALAGVWELAGLEHKLGDLTRALARAEDVYYPRAVFQKAVISIVIAAVVVSLGIGWRKRSARLLPLGFGLYLAIALVNLLSLHALDQFAGRSWHDVTLVDAAKLLCAITALVGLYRSPTPSAPTP
jgi:hypothetical protein